MLPRVSDAELWVDAMTVVAGSLAIALWSHRLPVMTALVPALVLLRFVLWVRASRVRGAPLGAELALFALCTALGAFNDWSSVDRHGVYDYTVPVYFPAISTIPLWMLLWWGIILRLMLTVASSARLGAKEAPRNRVRLGVGLAESAAGRLALLVVLLLITRQGIYRFSLDPVLSWLPFACALALYPLLFGVSRHELRVAGVTLVAGPLVEVIYIQVAGLHVYHLGWIGGVPLWIVLWWVLAVLLWADLGRRLQGALEAWFRRSH